MNPNRTRDELKGINVDDPSRFPLFTRGLYVDKFRSISDLNLDFIHPITVLAGTNKIGKTSIMAMLACSHVEFQMRNFATGQFERCTWSRLIKFTKHDEQTEDWSYKISYKKGRELEQRDGRRLVMTKKWSGVAKRESQFERRKVIYLDLDRITPAHACSNVLFLNTQASTTTIPLDPRVGSYFEYVFETPFNLAQIAQHQNRTSYRLGNKFTSFNSASGEDVLLAILLDTIQADKNSLILIDELELGLHPKIQRRLVDVLMDIALTDNKQFIVSTHSPTLLSAFDRNSRIFIEKGEGGSYKAIPKISVNAAFSKMDSEIFPLVNLFCEDKESVQLINKALEFMRSRGHKDIHKLVNVISSGSASCAEENYDVFKRTWGHSKINIGYALILDGDQRSAHASLIGTEDHISFLFSNESPERFLLRHHLSLNPDENLQYHLDKSNPHILFSKCVEASIAITESEVFEKLYTQLSSTADYINWLEEFESFIVDTCTYFSDKL